MAGFGSVERYLKDIPGGPAGLRECRVKASIYRSLIDAHPLEEAELEALPPEVADLIRDPRPVSTWVPEVQSTCALLAVYDARFAPDQGAYLAACYEMQRRLFSGRLYRLAFSLVGPRMLLRGAAARWGAFHKGSSAQVEARPGGGDIELQYPRGLYAELPLRALGEGLRAALDVAGARESALTLAEWGPTSARFVGRWSG